MARAQSDQPTVSKFLPLSLSAQHRSEALFLSAFRSSALRHCQNIRLNEDLEKEFGSQNGKCALNHFLILSQLIAKEAQRHVDLNCPNISRITSAEGWLLHTVSGAQRNCDATLLMGMVGVLDAPPSHYLVKLIRRLAVMFAESDLRLDWTMPSSGPIYLNHEIEKIASPHSKRGVIACESLDQSEQVAA